VEGKVQVFSPSGDTRGSNRLAVVPWGTPKPCRKRHTKSQRRSLAQFQCAEQHALAFGCHPPLQEVRLRIRAGDPIPAPATVARKKRFQLKRRLEPTINEVQVPGRPGGELRGDRRPHHQAAIDQGSDLARNGAQRRLWGSWRPGRRRPRSRGGSRHRTGVRDSHSRRRRHAGDGQIEAPSGIRDGRHRLAAIEALNLPRGPGSGTRCKSTESRRLSLCRRLGRRHAGIAAIPAPPCNAGQQQNGELSASEPVGVHGHSSTGSDPADGPLFNFPGV
jgi:hypothetical protein